MNIIDSTISIFTDMLALGVWWGRRSETNSNENKLCDEAPGAQGKQERGEDAATVISAVESAEEEDHLWKAVSCRWRGGTWELFICSSSYGERLTRWSWSFWSTFQASLWHSISQRQQQAALITVLPELEGRSSNILWGGGGLELQPA